MRASQAEKDRSRERIVGGAARLLRERGIETTSVSDVMSDAGMTNGGFYKHFESKDALVATAVRAAFDEMIALIDSQAGVSGSSATYQDYYLSDDHVRSPGAGCPVAALSGDVGRGPEALKAEFGAGVRRAVRAIADLTPGSEADSETEAARSFAAMVGAVMIARASDQDTAAMMLGATRERLMPNAPARNSPAE